MGAYTKHYPLVTRPATAILFSIYFNDCSKLIWMIPDSVPSLRESNVSTSSFRRKSVETSEISANIIILFKSGMLLVLSHLETDCLEIFIFSASSSCDQSNYFLHLLLSGKYRKSGSCRPASWFFHLKIYGQIKC